MTIAEQMAELARRARGASRELARLETAEKDDCLLAMAEGLETRRDQILEANGHDLQTGEAAGLAPALMDRLRLTEQRVAAMAEGLRRVARLPDPVGRVLEERTLANGLKLQKVAVPVGVIVVIFEARPNVTADAAGLCFKSGNATILRGGKEARHSNSALAEILVQAAAQKGKQFPKEAIQLVSTTDRAAIPALLALSEDIDLCIPRGGEGLIRAVAECSRVPVIKHYKGVCHVYVDGEADSEMATSIVLNAKVQRPGVCNAMETLLVDEAIAPTFLAQAGSKLVEQGVELRADSAGEKLLALAGVPCRPATEDDWSAEYLDLVLSVRVVPGVRGAIDHIQRYGSGHSDAIVTQHESHARQFLREVDSAAVYWNASTRFTDGAQFGMGAEIGISTDKIGARGPMGLEELTSYKWVGVGEGQVRT